MSTVKSKKLQLGTDANAANNFTLYQPASPDGTLRIGQGNADSPTEVGQFNANGYKPASLPIFSAYQSTAQAITNDVATKLTMNTESLDTLSDYDTTNYRYTPSVAGYYNIGGRVQMTPGATVGELFMFIYKNGTAIVRLAGSPMVNSTYPSPASSYPVYMNGSTDYVELYVWQSNSAARNTNPGEQLTYFYGHLIQQA